MICPRCQHANKPGTFICSNCGFNSQLDQRAPFARLRFAGRRIFIFAAFITIILGVFALISFPDLLTPYGPNTHRETGAIQILKILHNSQLHYQSLQGRFGTLKELTEAGFLTDKSYASGKAISQYIYTDSDVSTDTYCIHADRQSNGSGIRDFNITEDGVVYFIESKTKGTVSRGAGTPITIIDATTERPDETPKK